MLFSAPLENEDGPPVEENRGRPLSEMTVVELKALVKEMGITGYSTMSKDELIAAAETAGKE